MTDIQNLGLNSSFISTGDASIFGASQLADTFGIVKTKLQQAANDPTIFTEVFGSKASTAEFQSVISQWKVGDFSQLPSVRIISSANTNGAVGAYANQTIYLSDALFQPNSAPISSMFGASGVLVEETFHFLDSLVGSDTAGDEGEYAKNLTFGVSLGQSELNRIRSEDDRGFITVNGQQVLAELAFDYAGNSLSTARNITLGSSSTTFQDWVGSADTNDYYRFSVGGTSNLNLSLNGLSADADVQLLDGNGSVIQSSTNSGTSAESIIRQVNAGTYFIRVFPYSGANTNYNLNASVVPVAPPDYAGNSLSTARNITLGSSSTTFQDWVGSADTNDYYRFSVGGTSNLNLSLNGLSADADVQLLDGNGSVIQSSTNSGTSAESIIRQVNAGTYFIRVFPYSGANTNYNLNASVVPVAPPDYAGNSLSTARNITLGSSSTTFQDWVGSVDTNDYYRFSVGGTSNLNLSLNGLSADADVQLLDGNGSVIQSSTNGGTSAESIIRQVNAGTYFIRVFPSSGSTYYNLNASATTVVPPGDWYTQNLRDAGIVSLTRSLAADGSLSRNDIIAIFRNAEDGGVIDANELTDFRTILANSSRFAIADYVKVLANKVANGEVANTVSGFGNLYAGSSSAQMENLIGKWFLGTDRPDTSYTYRYTSGSLFQNGISADDINQNALGDCYFLATLSSIAQEKSSYIQNLFIDNGDNTFTVRFFNGGVADYVTVDRYLPTTSSGAAAYAGWGGGSYSSSTNELWVALAEKAYAQLAESGWSRSRNSTNAYASIEGGWMDSVIRQVTGLSTTSQSATTLTQSQLIDLVNSNKILTVGFVNGANYGVYNNHAYTITSYNASTGTFRLRNPWGTRHADVTWSQLQSLKGTVIWSNT